MRAHMVASPCQPKTPLSTFLNGGPSTNCWMGQALDSSNKDCKERGGRKLHREKA